MMAGPAFDPNGAVKFDLKSGAASDARGQRVVLLPSAAIDALAKNHENVFVQLGNELGRACGARVAQRLGGDNGVRGAQLEVVVSHLAGELAIAGIGAVHVERWGRAMVCVVTNPSVNSEAFVGAVVAGALSAAASRELVPAAIGNEGGEVRFFVGTRATADRARTLAAQGKKFSEIVAALQGGAS
jgi:hypothetical protein